MVMDGAIGAVADITTDGGAVVIAAGAKNRRRDRAASIGGLSYFGRGMPDGVGGSVLVSKNGTLLVIGTFFLAAITRSKEET